MHRQPRLLFGTSAGITKVVDQCARFARTRDPMVLVGQRGTGKTALAEHIHELSRRPGEFVEESAAGLPRDMEVARLAGHVKGAFTDAREDRPGLLEVAHGGTFFLDEVQLASAQLQGVLLRLLERSCIRRLGDVRERPVDVRLIAASNEDLNALVAEGRFRADLLDRFGCMTVRMPPLAERRDEIIPLAERFLAEAASEHALDSQTTMSVAMQDLLLASPWPGNIRQLRSVCRTALALAAPRGHLGVEDLPLDFVAPLGDLGRVRYSWAAEREQRLGEALERTHGNKAKAARLLGVSRQTLYRWMEARPA
jgi:two-component system response regulator HydG